MTSYLSIRNISSTLYDKAGLGVISLAVIYMGVFTCCVFAPVAVHNITCKYAIFSSFIAQLLFTAANFYPTFYTLIPASALLGTTLAFMWTGQGLYVKTLAKIYTPQNEDYVQILSKFNGIFYSFFLTSQIWGNLITSLILNYPIHKKFDVSIIFLEQDELGDNETLNVCGFNFCDVEANVTVSNEKPPESLVHITLYAFLALDTLALIITFLFVTNHRPDVTSQPQFCEAVTSTLRLHTNKLQLSLIPLYVWTGLDQAFMFGEYTQVTYTLQ